MSTKTEFLAKYRDVLRHAYDWARPVADQDTPKLERYMASVENTIKPQPDGSYKQSWTCDGEALTKAWREMGQTGKPTLKALRALMPSLLPAMVTGFVLLHQSTAQSPVTTVGYYSTESRCKHVAKSINDRGYDIVDRAWCIPDDHELRDQGL